MLYMKMSTSSRIFSSFVVTGTGMLVTGKLDYTKVGLPT